MLCMASDARDTYIHYLPVLEKKKEERVLKDYRDRLALMDKRRQAKLFELIKATMGKCHFVAVMGLHDSHEIREMKVNCRLNLLSAEIDYLLGHFERRD